MIESLGAISVFLILLAVATSRGWKVSELEKACDRIEKDREELSDKLHAERQENKRLTAKVAELSAQVLACDHQAVEDLKMRLASSIRENQRLTESVREERARADYLESVVAAFHDLSNKVARPAPRQAQKATEGQTKA